jgi:hypothetical protein
VGVDRQRSGRIGPLMDKATGRQLCNFIHVGIIKPMAHSQHGPDPLQVYVAPVRFDAGGDVNRARMAQTHKFLAANDKTDLTPDG